MVAVPFIKIAALTIKTLAKPVAKRLKAEAANHELLKRVVIGLGQGTHYITARLTIRAAGHTAANIKPLDEAKAMASGGDILAESFIYAVAGALVIYEYKTSADKTAAKEAMSKAAKEEEKRQMQEALDSIHERLEALEKSKWGIGLGLGKAAAPAKRPLAPGMGRPIEPAAAVSPVAVTEGPSAAVSTGTAALPATGAKNGQQRQQQQKQQQQPAAASPSALAAAAPAAAGGAAAAAGAGAGAAKQGEAAVAAAKRTPAVAAAAVVEPQGAASAPARSPAAAAATPAGATTAEAPAGAPAPGADGGGWGWLDWAKGKK